MTPERWQQVGRIFEAALRRKPEGRANFLDQACATDHELRREVEFLLASHERAGCVIESSPPTIAAMTDRPAVPPSTVAAMTERQSMVGRKLGDFEMLAFLGAGGMGEVYRARDRRLGREVAIKILPSLLAERPEAQARFEREAKAVAALSHPNILSIFHFGSEEGLAYAVTELLNGENLRARLRRSVLPWRQAVEIGASIAEGVAAAHAKGIVHRDLKPENIFLTADGQVKILDFGIAHQGVAPLESTWTAEKRSLAALTTESAAKTMPGTVMGTRGYMSPEQLRGEVVTSSSDIFSLGCILYETLAGVGPFTRATVAETMAATLNEEPPPLTAQIPGELDALIRECLRKEPAERFPSAKELAETLEAIEADLERLEREPSRARWRMAAAAGIVLLIAAGGWFSYRLAQRRSQVCQGAQSKLAGVWDEKTKQMVSAAFLATQKPYAADAVRGTGRVLDDYARRWTAMQTEACEATRLRGEQSEELLDLRMSCLAHRLEELRSLTRLLASADTQLVATSVSAAQALSEVDDCAQAELLKSPLKPPGNLETRAKVEELRLKLAPIKALEDSGKYKEALPLASSVLAASKALQYRPLEAEALFQLGTLQVAMGDYGAAEKTLIDAGLKAESTRHDEVAARAWTTLIVADTRSGKFEQAELWGKHAIAAVERVGNPGLLAGVFRALTSASGEQGKYEEALSYSQRALEIAGKLKNDREVLYALNNIGGILRMQGKLKEALPYLERSLRLKEEMFGPAHPDIGTGLHNLGTVKVDEGKYDEALSLQNRGLEITERALGPDHPSIAYYANSIAVVLLKQGKHSQALLMSERALALDEKARGAEHPILLYSLTGIGEAYLKMGKPAKAIPPLERALAISERKQAEPAVLGEARFALARALSEAGREPNRATRLATQAREAFITAGAAGQKELDQVNQWLSRKR